MTMELPVVCIFCGRYSKNEPNGFVFVKIGHLAICEDDALAAAKVVNDAKMRRAALKPNA